MNDFFLSFFFLNTVSWYNSDWHKTCYIAKVTDPLNFPTSSLQMPVILAYNTTSNN